MQKNMMSSLMLLGSCWMLCALLVMPAHAGLLAYEPFDYGDSTLSGQTGGTGWSAAWARENATTSAGSLAAPAGYGYTPIGGRIDTLASNGRTFGRKLSTSIDMDPVSQTTYYISALFRRTDGFNGGAGEWMNILQLRPSSGADSNNFGATGSGEFVQGKLGGNTGAASANAFTLGSTYLVLVKIVANPSGTSDEAYISIFESGVDTVVEPTIWDATASADSSEVLVEFSSNFGANVDHLEIDEVRIGTEYADVVPEPAAAMLLLCAGASLFSVRRRASW